jgi:hypothetical protein
MASRALDDVSLAEYGTIISDFLQRIEFDMPVSSFDSSIEPALSAYIEEQPWPESLKVRAEKLAKGPAMDISSWYPGASFQSRFQSVVITLLVIIYDEDFQSFGDAGTEFSSRLISGKEQKAPFLDSLAQ